MSVLFKSFDLETSCLVQTMKVIHLQNIYVKFTYQGQCDKVEVMTITKYIQLQVVRDRPNFGYGYGFGAKTGSKVSFGPVSDNQGSAKLRLRP